MIWASRDRFEFTWPRPPTPPVGVDLKTSSPRSAFPTRGAEASAFDHLTMAGLVYIALPNILFLATWVRPIAGIPVAIALALALWSQSTVHVSTKTGRWPPLSAISVAILVAGIWTAFGGAGHIGFANLDWRTRDSVYGDLIRYSWPVTYQLPDGAIGVLRTAMAYYLPAASLAKLFGTGLADFFLYLWTAIGTAIFLLLLPISRLRSGLQWLLPLVCVVMFSGMDALGSWIDNLFLWPRFPDHIEWWAQRYQYSSMTTQLFWVPNHALAAWIACALLFRHRNRAGRANLAVLTLALLPLWSPFSALGFAPFVVWAMWGRMRKAKSSPLSLLTIATAAVLAYISGRFITTGTTNIALGTTLFTEAHNDVSDFSWYYVLFVLLEFGALTLILAKRSKAYGDLLTLAGIILLALPFARLGPGNDIVMRSSIPALTILCLITVNVIAKPTFWKIEHLRTSILLIAILVAGSVTAIHEMARTLMNQRWNANYEKTLREQSHGKLPLHYVGTFDKTELKWLLNEPADAH